MLGLLNHLNESDQRQEHFAQSADMDIADFVHSYVKHRLERFGEAQLRVLQVLLSEVLINRELYYQQVIAPTFALAEHYFEQWSMQDATTSQAPHLTLALSHQRHPTRSIL